MKILLFGAAGLLGRHLHAELAAHDHQLTALTHGEADITDAKCLEALFAQHWDAVINAAAICHFDACEDDPDGTARVNRDAPIDLARRCQCGGAVFVQFSSDYIFRGDLARPLTETDAPAPLSVYGHQKAALERDIPALCPRSLVIRLSWLYGPGGRTFMSLLPGLLATQGSLRVAAGKTGTCLYAPDAAQSVRQLLEHKQVGRFNLVNTGDTSWEEFARACLEEMDSLGLAPACRQIIEVPYGQLGANWNKRPRSSGLDTTKIAHALPPGLRHWREALKAFLHTQVALGDLTRAEL